MIRYPIKWEIYGKLLLAKGTMQLECQALGMMDSLFGNGIEVDCPLIWKGLTK